MSTSAIVSQTKPGMRVFFGANEIQDAWIDYLPLLTLFSETPSIWKPSLARLQERYSQGLTRWTATDLLDLLEKGHFRFVCDNEWVKPDVRSQRADQEKQSGGDHLYYQWAGPIEEKFAGHSSSVIFEREQLDSAWSRADEDIAADTDAARRARSLVVPGQSAVVKLSEATRKRAWRGAEGADFESRATRQLLRDSFMLSDLMGKLDCNVPVQGSIEDSNSYGFVSNWSPPCIEVSKESKEDEIEQLQRLIDKLRCTSRLNHKEQLERLREERVGVHLNKLQMIHLDHLAEFIAQDVGESYRQASSWRAYVRQEFLDTIWKQAKTTSFAINLTLFVLKSDQAAYDNLLEQYSRGVAPFAAVISAGLLLGPVMERLLNGNRSDAMTEMKGSARYIALLSMGATKVRVSEMDRIVDELRKQ